MIRFYLLYYTYCASYQVISNNQIPGLESRMLEQKHSQFLAVLVFTLVLHLSTQLSNDDPTLVPSIASILFLVPVFNLQLLSEFEVERDVDLGDLDFED